jgi:hypothetical protein
MRLKLGNPAFDCKHAMSTTDQPCEHVRAGQWPFQVELVLDEHLGPAEALMKCRRCGRFYLLEMLDWRGTLRVMRIAALDATQAERLIRDLTRGSCDINRAGAEVQHMRTLAPWTRRLLLVDNAGPVIDAVADVPADVRIPSGSWRGLPCDGTWVDYLRSNSEIVNE